MLSHSTMRRLIVVFAAAFGFAVLSASPAQAATKLVSANNVKSVIAYLKSKGDTVTQGESDVGNVMLTESDNLYDVHFDCDDNHTNCSAIQFRACYADYPNANLEKTNALSRDYFFGKSYISEEGYACIELPVPTGTGGISYEALDRAFDAFLWFRQNTDEAFN